MTTIAIKDGCMAADQRVTGGGAFYPATKIFRIGKSLFGTAGDGDMGLVVIEWLKTKPRDRKELYSNWTEHTERYDVLLLELNASGIFQWSGWGLPERIHLTEWAIGSGQLAALQEMKRGGSAIDAVKASMDWDESTGPGIQFEYLDPPKTFPNEFKKRKR